MEFDDQWIRLDQDWIRFTTTVLWIKDSASNLWFDSITLITRVFIGTVVPSDGSSFFVLSLGPIRVRVLTIFFCRRLQRTTVTHHWWVTAWLQFHLHLQTQSSNANVNCRSRFAQTNFVCGCLFKRFYLLTKNKHLQTFFVWVIAAVRGSQLAS